MFHDYFQNSLAKIAFIRKGNKKIEVRETDYVPDFLYLQNNHYDISHASLLKADNDFSGQIIIRNWKDKIVSMKRMQEGTITGNLKKRVVAAASFNNDKATSANSGDCEPLFDCIFVEVCDETIYPDKLVTYTNCELINTGDCVPLDNCPPDPCEGMSSEECACWLYGDCDDNGGGGGGDDDGEVESIKVAHVEFNIKELPGQLGYGYIFESVRFEGKFYKKHPENNKFSGNADASNLRIVDNNVWGPQNQPGIYTYSNVQNVFSFPSNTTANLVASGNVKFPNNSTFDYTGTVEKSLTNLYWQ